MNHGNSYKELFTDWVFADKDHERERNKNSWILPLEHTETKAEKKKNSLMKRSNEAKNGIQNTFYFGRFSTFKKTSIKHKRGFLVECLRCKYKNPRNRHSSVFLFFSISIFFSLFSFLFTKHDKLFSKSTCYNEIRRTRKIWAKVFRSKQNKQKNK